jgi:hypothetical protein
MRVAEKLDWKGLNSADSVHRGSSLSQYDAISTAKLVTDILEELPASLFNFCNIYQSIWRHPYTQGPRVAFSPCYNFRATDLKVT